MVKRRQQMRKLLLDMLNICHANHFEMNNFIVPFGQSNCVFDSVFNGPNSKCVIRHRNICHDRNRKRIHWNFDSNPSRYTYLYI